MHTYLQNLAHKSEVCSINNIKYVFNTRFEISNVCVQPLYHVILFQFSVFLLCTLLSVFEHSSMQRNAMHCILYWYGLCFENFHEHCPYSKHDIIKHKVVMALNQCFRTLQRNTRYCIQKTLWEEMRAFKNYRPSYYYYHNIDSKS